MLVRADPRNPGTVLIEAMDPGILVEVTGEPALIAIADEVTAKLGAAIASLAPRGQRRSFLDERLGRTAMAGPMVIGLDDSRGRFAVDIEWAPRRAGLQQR